MITNEVSWLFQFVFGRKSKLDAHARSSLPVRLSGCLRIPMNMALFMYFGVQCTPNIHLIRKPLPSDYSTGRP
jgi:hypothetical protein